MSAKEQKGSLVTNLYQNPTGAANASTRKKPIDKKCPKLSTHEYPVCEHKKRKLVDTGRDDICASNTHVEERLPYHEKYHHESIREYFCS